LHSPFDGFADALEPLFARAHGAVEVRLLLASLAVSFGQRPRFGK